MKVIATGLAAILAFSAAPVLAKPKPAPVPAAPVPVEVQAAALRDDALKSNVAYDFLSELTTRFGPRPAGSEREKQAAEWAAGHLKELQLIDNQFDGTSGTLRARAVFQNSEGKLIPGQFVRVHMGAAQQKPALLVSELAVGTDQSKRFVYVVGADHKVAYREVTLGGTANGLRIVTSGLKDGERIVVSGLQHVGPAADQWGVYGTGEKHELVKDTTVRGGAAFQITSAGKGTNPWDIQAGISNSKAVKKGDVVLLAFWGRAVTPGTATIPAVVQQSAAPYTRIGEQALNLTADWRLHYVTATADKDYPAGTLGVSVQLATAAQTVALGPVFLLDFGPGYDPKYLPRNIP